MKKSLLIMLFSILIMILGFEFAQAQSAWFDNGTIGVELRNYGEIEIYSPVTATDTIYQIDRLSSLVGVSPDSVFSWRTDQDWEEEPELVSSPQYSDFEIYASVNNSYSFEPPDVLIKMNLYGWISGGYSIMKYTIINRELIPLNFHFGFEIIPEPDGSYGYETVQYNPIYDMFMIFIDSTHTGMKFLSPNLGGLKTIEWYSGYDNNDADLYSWLSYGKIDTLFVSTNDNGTVEIPSLDEKSLNSGDSLVVYIALVVGPDENAMLTSLAEAEQTYHNVFTRISANPSVVPGQYRLEQNFPNPFNPTTQIAFQVSQKEKVTLIVFNSLGQAVSVLVNEEVNPGEYQLDFDAANLPAGIYYYQLKSESFMQTKKMLILK
jgi:hypothetical protein